ncbi:hypothetical protein DFH29DRAFT_871746 [Suillus ampliporus]|nr:hypothetical protein DFH29DRAFT_871746 [Suillus ampliporus]
MKLLTDEFGFQAMLDAVQECMKDYTIFLYLLKPIDLEGPPEVLSRCNMRYGYNEDSSVPPEYDVAISHKAQITLTTCLHILELFASRKHQGSHGVGTSLPHQKPSSVPEQANICDEWLILGTEAAIHQSTQSDPRATYDMPPVLNYFMKDKAIKPASYGAYAKGKNYTPESHGAPTQPSSAPLVPALATGTVTDSYPSPGITTKHSTTLEAFCTKFVVSASNLEKLSKLGYDLGNRIVESLTMDDWQYMDLTFLDIIGTQYNHCLTHFSLKIVQKFLYH